MEHTDYENDASSGRTMLFGLHTRKIWILFSHFQFFIYVTRRRRRTRAICLIFAVFLFQHAVKNDPKFEFTLNNLLDIYNVGSFVKKSIFGSYIDNLMFFYRQKSHQYKYIFDEVGT